jgi:hypothetical protein
MRACGFKARLIILTTQLSVWGVVSPQDIPSSQENLELFRIEILAFTYNAFDPTEEHFNRKPPPIVFDTLTTESAEVLPPDNTNYYQQLLLEPPKTSALQNEAIEADLSISERILSSLLPLEEETEPVGSFESANHIEPIDPLIQEAPIDPSFEDQIAVEDSFESFDSLESELLEIVPAEELFQFRLLGLEELELTEAYRRLNNLNVYTLLAHGGWVQEGLPEEDAFPFNLALLGALNPTGTVQLHLSRFLHVKVVLNYRARPGTPLPPQFATYDDVLEEFNFPPVYELRATRRARSGELHYFDHPAFGLLVIIKPHTEIIENIGEMDEPSNLPRGPAAYIQDNEFLSTTKSPVG